MSGLNENMRFRINKSGVAVRVVGDSVLGIAAICVMNTAMQMLAYPALERTFGSEGYGDKLYFISIVNLIAVSIGSSLNSERLLASIKGDTSSNTYNVFLCAVGVFEMLISVAVLYFHDGTVRIIDSCMYWLLMYATTIRYYADVEYRLKIEYKGYLKYYLCIAVGYAIGAIIVQKTKIWYMALIPGELLGLLYASIRGELLKHKNRCTKAEMVELLHGIKYLVASQLLVNLVLNSDRLVLKALCSGTEVTAYYIASLIGKTIALVIVPFNSVIIGYLVKTKKKISAERFLFLMGIGVVISGLFLPICVIASYVFTYFIYPQQMQNVSSLFVSANLAQIIYFVCSIYATILLRYIDEKYQMWINICYIGVFGLIAVPLTSIYGLKGYTYGVLISNTLRYGFIGIFGYTKLKCMNRKEKVI